MAVLTCKEGSVSHEIQSVSFINPNNREVIINPYRLFDYLGDDFSDGFDNKSKCFPVCRLRVVGMDFEESVEAVLINGCKAEVGHEYIISLLSDDAEDIEEFRANIPRDDMRKNGYYLITAASDTYPVGKMDVEIFYKVNTDGESFGKFFRVVFTKNVIRNGTEHFRGSGVSMTDTNSSFLLMRSDPRLTGNIKLVVDKEDNMFLDTFHVTENLSRREYRHVSVSSSSKYSTDIRNVFSSLSTDDIYACPDKSLRPHAVITDYESQFDMTYAYGAETNRDEMYAENYSIFAPLWLNKVIPDFFAVFRVDGPVNQNSYETSLLSQTELMRSFLRDGEAVKVFDLREGTPLGDYIRNYYKEIGMYTGSMYLQFIEREEPDDYRNGINSWIGVSLDSGEIVKMDEVSYFTDEKISEGSQEKLAQFLTDGFSRNRLICPHLINLQFMFDDKDVDTYSMNRYYGLYMMENDIVKYDYLESVVDRGTGNFKIRKFGADHEPIDDSFLKGSGGILSSGDFSDRMFFAITKNDAVRVKDYSDLNTFLRQNVVNLPSDSLFNIDARRVLNPGYKSFMTFTLTKPVRYGEHFRVCIPTFSENGESMSVVLEVIASNDRRLVTKDDFVSPYVTVNNRNYDTNYYVWYRHNDIPDGVKPKQDNYYMADTGQSKYTEFRYMEKVKYSRNGAVFEVKESDRVSSDGQKTVKYPYIFRMCFYTQDEEDENVPATVDEQIKRICRCFEVFSNELNVGVKCNGYSGDAVSIATEYAVAYFQHITADILDNGYYDQYKELLESGMSPEDAYLNVDCTEEEGIRYFGTTSVSVKTHLLSNDSNLYYSDSIIFAPLNFENLGWRKSSIVRLCNFSEYLYEVTVDDLTKLMGNTLIRMNDGGYRRLSTTIMKDYAVAMNGVRSKIYEYLNELLLVRSPFNPSKWLVMCDDEAYVPSGKMGFYSPVSVGLSLMGILPVKDIDCGFTSSQATEISSSVPIRIPTDTEVTIGRKSDYYILPGVYYDIVQGTIGGLNRGVGFIVIDQILYYGSNMDGRIMTMDVPHDILRTTAETVLKPRMSGQTYDYTISPMEFGTDGFYENDSVSNSLLYSLSVPSAVVWESVGRYYDGDGLLRIENLNNDYKPDMMKGYLTAYRADAGGRLLNRGISHNMDSLVKVMDSDGTERTETFRQYLSDSMEMESMNLFLTDDATPLYSVGYYNEYVNTLDFTAYGIRFSLTFDSNDYVRQIQLSNYNKYEIFMLLDYMSDRNEMFINTIENVILIVCHNFDPIGQAVCGNLFTSAQGSNFSPNGKYGWMSMGMSLDLNGMEANVSQLFIPLSETAKDDISGDIIQLNISDDDGFSYDKTYNSLVKVDGVEIAKGDTYINRPAMGQEFSNYLNWKESEDSSVSTSHIMKRTVIDPEDYGVDEHKTYIVKEKSGSADDVMYEDFDALRTALINAVSMEDNYEIFIKHKNGYDVVTDHISTSATYKPISISCSYPKHVKYLSDFYNPHFVPVMDFALNENNTMIERTRKNFVLCDTHFKEVKPMGGMFGMKVFQSDVDVSLGGNRTNLFRTEMDVTLSDWDKGFFRRYGTDGVVYSEVDGYMTGVDVKSFFGSRCISIKGAEFEITDWNATNVSTIVVEKERIIITINLTRAFIMHFLNGNEKTFTENWRYFRYNSDSMNNYVKKSLIRHFKINNRNDFSLYACSTELNPIVHLTVPSNSEEYEKVDNFESSYTNDNEEVIMRIVLRDVNKSYYFGYRMASNII